MVLDVDRARSWAIRLRLPIGTIGIQSGVLPISCLHLFRPYDESYAPPVHLPNPSTASGQATSGV